MEEEEPEEEEAERDVLLVPPLPRGCGDDAKQPVVPQFMVVADV